MYLSMSTSWTAWVPDPPEEVQGRLRDAVREGALQGDVDDLRFSLTHRIYGRNSWRPHLTGTLQRAGTGTLVEVKLAVHPLVLVFTMLHAIPFMGITWLMGVAAFSGPANTAIALLRETTEATVEGDAVRDLLDDQVAAPDEPGAESHAPWSLRARTSLDGARFVLRGPQRWLGTTTTVLDVDHVGLTVAHHANRERRAIPWHALREARVAEGQRVVELVHDEGTERIDAGGHGPSHLDWLVRYLEHRRRQWAADPEEARRFEAEARRLLARSAARTTRSPDG